jgi:hypothetical protein
MTRPRNERRNQQIIVLVERRRLLLKEVPSIMARRGFMVTYENVRAIVSRFRKMSASA